MANHYCTSLDWRYLQLVSILVICLASTNASAESQNDIQCSLPITQIIDLKKPGPFTAGINVEHPLSGGLSPKLNSSFSLVAYYGKDADILSYLPFSEITKVPYRKGDKKWNATPDSLNEWNDNILIGKISHSASGKFGRSLLFEGGHLASGLYGANITHLRKTGFSISAWIRPDDLAGKKVIASSGPYYKITSSLFIDEGHLKYVFLGENGRKTTVWGTTLIAEDQWHHVAAVYDPGKAEARIYLNGQLEGYERRLFQNEVFGIVELGMKLYVGKDSTHYNPFMGEIDEVVIYSRPLSDDYVKDVYQGQLFFGSYESSVLPIADQSECAGQSFNSVKLSVSETNPGSTQVYIWQNNEWHRQFNNQISLFAMPHRLPVSSLKYKLVFTGRTELKDLRFEFSNNTLVSEGHQFSFMFIGDENGMYAHQAIKDACTTAQDLALIFSIPDNGWGTSTRDLYKRYRNHWSSCPQANWQYAPIFIGLGNHDVEHTDNVDYLVRKLGLLAPKSLPGMTNFRFGPFDVYPNGYEDRYLSYSFDYMNTHFIMINGYYQDLILGQDRFNKDYTPISHVSNELLSWVEDSLMQTTAKHKFVAFHEGAFPPPGARHRGDSLDWAGAPGNNGPNNTRPMRDKFWTLLAKYQVTATLMGHNHTPSQTWVADPSNQYGPVYELEPGDIKNIVRYALISVSDDEAIVNYLSRKDNKKEFQQSHKPLIINRQNSAHHYPPVLYHHSASIDSGFPAIDKRHYRVEVGYSFDRSNALYFEAKDNNINDKLKFRFYNLPPFLNINDQAQFRRVYLSSEPLTTADTGDYSFDVEVTDGTATDKMTMTVSVFENKQASDLATTIDGMILLHRNNKQRPAR